MTNEPIGDAQARREAGGPPGPSDFEELLRRELVSHADGIAPGPTPYEAIVRQGRSGRRRRVGALGAGLIVLAAVPGVAIALQSGGGHGAMPATPSPSAASSGPAASSSPAASPSPAKKAGPTGPAHPGQLVDGITAAQAGEALASCLSYGEERDLPKGYHRPEPGGLEDFHILLAMRATPDDNAPAAGIKVVAVNDTTDTRIICQAEDGEASGLNTSGGDHGHPEGRPVYSDINGGKLYRQASLDGSWNLPYRWGNIGTVDDSVARVTVGYGGETRQAFLDHGWYVATGVMTEQTGGMPRIKGYDDAGRLIYDSADDPLYEAG